MVKLKSAERPNVLTSARSSSALFIPFPTLESGSNWSDLVISAEFKTLPACVIFAVNESVREVPPNNDGIEAVKIPLLFTKSVAFTNSKPSGKISFTSTFVAVEGPALLTVR